MIMAVSSRTRTGMVSPSSSWPSLSSIARLQIVILITFCSSRVIRAEDYNHEENFCPVEAIVDLTNATKDASGFLTDDESGYSFPPGTVRNFMAGVRQGCICDLKPCLPLCPPVKRPMTEGNLVAKDFANYEAIPAVYTANLTLDDDEERQGPEERFHILIWDPCPGKDMYFLEPEKYESDGFHLLGNGSLFLPQMDDLSARFLDLDKYCLRLRGNDSSYTPKVCSPEIVMEYKRDDFVTAKYVGGLATVPFLIVTVIVYSVLPELKNLYGRTLICHLSCLIVTFVALAADRIPQPDSSASILRLSLGFTIYASFLAAFFWLNVMCFDMWWTFGGFGTLNSNGVQQKNKKFIRYSIYAWGIPVVLTAICIGMEFSSANPESLIHPGFRINAGWFRTKEAEALYFYGPLSVTIICNIGFFISTSIAIVRQNEDTKRELDNGNSRRHDDRKQHFNLHLKLFVVMGISWSTEIISWLWEGPKYVWHFTDMVNALMGILIFVIFVCKRNVWQSLKERYKKK